MFKLSKQAREIYSFLLPPEKLRIQLSVFALVILNLLDLIAIFLMGMIGVLTISGTGNGTVHPNGLVAGFLRETGLTDLKFQNQIAILGLLATFLFVARTLISMLIVRKVYFFLGNVSTRITRFIALREFNLPINKLYQKSSQNILYDSISGVDALTLGVMASSISLIADLTLLFLISAALSAVNFLVTVFTVLYLGIIAFVLHSFLGPRTQTLGSNRAQISVVLNSKILGIFSSYRENSVKKRNLYLVEQIDLDRRNQSKILAEFAFLPSVSKYVLESSVILGVLILTASQFIMTDAKHAVGTLAIFLAAGSRIAPALLRAQQGLMVIRNSLGAAHSTIQTLKQLEPVQPLSLELTITEASAKSFSGFIVFDDVSFRYPDKNSRVIHGASFKLLPGELVAIVGPSGAGKTTLVDLMMGLILQDAGRITISGVTPNEAQAIWPSSFSYVPQNVYLTEGTVRENVCLGYPESCYNDEQIWKALEFAKLKDFVLTLPNGLNEQVGENGNKFSGGQRQRLGIARGALSVPSVLILDEATNALDVDTENQISHSLSEIRNKCTTIVIAHRKETVVKADKILLVKDSKVDLFTSWSSLEDFFNSKSQDTNLLFGDRIDSQ